MAAEKRKRVAHDAAAPVIAVPASKTTGNQYFNLALALGALAFLLLYWVRLDRTVGMFMDDAWYALLGKALATGQGYTLINSPTPGILPLYPPLYPALLAIIFKLSPNFPQNVWLLKCASILAMAAAGWLTYLYLVRYRQWNRVTALLVAALMAFSPGLVFMATASLMSECVFAALLLLAFVTVEHCAQQRASSRALVFAAIAAICCSLAFLTRSMALGVILAALLYFLKEKLFKPLVVFALVTGILLGGWTLYTRARKPTLAQRAEVNNYIVRPYNEQFWDRLAGYESQGSITLGELPERVLKNIGSVIGSDTGGILFPSFFPSLNQGLAERGSAIQLILSLLACALIVTGFVICVRERLTVAELAFPISLGIVILWPFPPYRFLLPYLPLLVLYFLTGFRLVGRAHRRLSESNLEDGNWLPLNVAAGVMLLTALLGNANYIGRQYEDFPQERPRMMRIFAEQEKVLQWAAENLPKNDVIVTPNPALTFLYTGNRTTTFDNAPGNWENWNKLGVRYLLQLSPVRLPEPNGPEKQYRVMHRAGGELNLRVMDLGIPGSRPVWGEAGIN